MSVNVDDTLELLLIEDNPGDATLFEHHLTTDRPAGSSSRSSTALF